MVIALGEINLQMRFAEYVNESNLGKRCGLSCLVTEDGYNISRNENGIRIVN